MTDIERCPEDETAYGDHLQRSESVWNRWSDWYRMSEQDFEPVREGLIAQLELEDGDTVLEVGCGPGVNFEPIRAAIGENGRLVAIDYSSEMIAKARDRVATNGWENVDVERADATTADLGGPYDAAIATLSLSVLPDIERALRNVRSTLEPGAPLGVLDLQAFQSGPARAFNPLLRRFLRWYANWNPDDDVLASIDDVFGGYKHLGTHFRGTAYTARARRSREAQRSTTDQDVSSGS